MGALCLHSRSRICLGSREILSVDFVIFLTFFKTWFCKEETKSDLCARIWDQGLAIFQNRWKKSSLK